MSKEISFSEFLKEGTLTEAELEDTARINNASWPIHIEADTPETDRKIRNFWIKLRHYFRTGERPKGLNGSLVPALLAPYLTAGNFANDYPVVILGDASTCVSLETFIESSFSTTFKADEAKILRKNLPRIHGSVRKLLEEKGSYCSFSEAWKIAVGDLESVDVHGDKNKLYLDDIRLFEKSLPKRAWLLRFSGEAPFVMLNVLLEAVQARRSDFIQGVEGQISTIEELISLADSKKGNKNKKKSGDESSQITNLISFDEVNKMIPDEGTIGYSETQIERLRNILPQLKDGSKAWLKHNAQVHITEGMFGDFSWEELLQNVDITRTTRADAYEALEDKFDVQMKTFCTFIGAHQMAGLELKDKFNEEIHGDYYEHFSWHRLTEQEIALFPPVILIGETAGFMRENMDKFSKLLAANKPVKLIAIEKRFTNAPNPEINWEDASHSFRQELAILAISHRSTYTIQSALNQPVEVYSGIQRALEVAAPCMMHFLIPELNDHRKVEVLKLTSAVESRFFPSINYDLGKGNKWGSRFNILANPQSEKNWPEYDLEFVDIDGSIKNMSLSFTYADYKAINKEKREELFLVPLSFETEDLVPIADYLNADAEDKTGKIPFLWLVNKENKLIKAAMPYMWVVSCQERLDNWNYIQELGGVNSYHVDEALKAAETKWQEQKEAEIAALRDLHQKELDRTRETAAGEAMDGLTNILLNLDASQPMVPSHQPTKNTVDEPVEVTKKEEGEIEKEVEETPEISEEAWVETFKCTTCNDCTDRFPSIFKYNEDKQAYIEDSGKGTYAQLVMAAEECPAFCIHPGQPSNPSEPNLDEWLERGNKFN